MELEFDKEIDALLRGTGREAPPSPDGGASAAHLDADEISAFAENALPDASRAFYVTHLADCAACRRRLVEFTSLAEKPEVEAARDAVAPAPASLPWWRRLFVMPGLAYAMGVLVLLFGGMAGFLALQRGAADGGSQMARIREEENVHRSPNAGSTSAAAESSNTATANSNALADTSPMNSLGNATTSNGAVGMPAGDTEPRSGPARDERADRPAEAAAGTALAAPQAAESSLSKEEQKPPPAADSSQPPKDEANAAAEKNRSREVQTDGVVATEAATSNRQIEELPTAARNQSQLRMSPTQKAGPRQNVQDNVVRQSANDAAVFRRRVEGRHFDYKDGVWYDASYNGAATINVRRGSDEFKDLDKGLRSIAGKLDGTIVVVWKGKAYRIQ